MTVNHHFTLRKIRVRENPYSAILHSVSILKEKQFSNAV